MKRTIALLIAGAFTLATASAQFLPRNHGYGPGNGTGTGIGPRDGSGYGAKSGKRNGSGTCDQTGPKGQQRGSQGRGRR